MPERAFDTKIQKFLKTLSIRPYINFALKRKEHAMETLTQPAVKQEWQRKDLYQEVTNKIIQQLEKGTIPWHKPWGDTEIGFTIPKNFSTGNFYRGINIVLLWSSAVENEYRSDEWATFKQWTEKKESIKKGEKGNLVVYYDTFEKEIEGEMQKLPFLKSSVVFNRCQLASYVPEEKPIEQEKPLVERINVVDDFVANTKAKIKTQGSKAYYKRSTDEIVMPKLTLFKNTETCTATEGYFSTLLHELTHWTGSEKRLNRLKGKKFGDKHYANEELVAELSAAFLCAGFGIPTLDKGDHAAYIQSWLKALKDDKRCIFTAASGASKAVEYLYSLQ